MNQLEGLNTEHPTYFPNEVYSVVAHVALDPHTFGWGSIGDHQAAQQIKIGLWDYYAD